jgi:predicted transcriptional regulator
MKKTRIEVRTESTRNFFGRLRGHAEALDRGEALPAAVTISFEDPVEMLRILSSERIRILKGIKGRPEQISVLASALKRDVRAVSRDIGLLEKAGLLRTSLISNPGHGRRRIVAAVAEEYKLVAHI